MTLPLRAPASAGQLRGSLSVQPLFRENGGLLIPDADGLSEGTSTYLLACAEVHADNIKKVVSYVFNDVLAMFLPAMGRELNTPALRELMDALIQIIHPLPDGDDAATAHFPSVVPKTLTVEGVIACDRLHTPERREVFTDLLLEAFLRIGQYQKPTTNRTRLETALSERREETITLLAKAKVFGFAAFAVLPPDQKVTSITTPYTIRRNGSRRYRKTPR